MLSGLVEQTILVETDDGGEEAIKLKSLRFCELVEHPGGRDGGEFPQYSSYYLGESGTVIYVSGLPEDRHCDVFVDENVHDYVNVTTKEEAIADLNSQIKMAEESVQFMKDLVQRLQQENTEFTVVVENDDGDEVLLDEIPDEDEDEDDE